MHCTKITDGILSLDIDVVLKHSESVTSKQLSFNELSFRHRAF